VKNNWGIVFAVILVFAALAWAAGEKEILELGTYVTGPIDRLLANRMTIGPAYQPASLPNSRVPDGNLLVSGNVGAGTTSPRSNPPNAVATGNLDANDVFVRGSSRWASQGGGGNGSHVAGGENSAAVSVPTSGAWVSLATAAVTTFGRPVMALGRVAGNFPQNVDSTVAVRLYRDGVLVDEVRALNGVVDGGDNFVVVTKTETLTAGSHTFELKASASNLSINGTVASGGAKLTVLEI